MGAATAEPDKTRRMMGSRSRFKLIQLCTWWSGTERPLVYGVRPLGLVAALLAAVALAACLAAARRTARVDPVEVLSE